MTPSFSHIKFRKDKLREKYKNLRASIDAETRSVYSSRICDTFINSNSFPYYDVILCYAPTGSEVNTDKIAVTALELGKKVAYPRIIGKGKMEFRYVNGLSQLKKQTFGIYEPGDECTLYVPDSKLCTCVLLPALCFDRFGHRLGYGGGYYDRFLSNYSGSSTGLAFSDCICDSLPFGKHDKCADVIITEGGVIAVEKKH